MALARTGKYYVLDDTGNPVVEDDLLKWCMWFETNETSVAYQIIGDIIVSTVFLGINHQFSDGPPILFETMIFGGPHDQYQERYTTREEALLGHEDALKLVRSGLH